MLNSFKGEKEGGGNPKKDCTTLERDERFTSLYVISEGEPRNAERLTPLISASNSGAKYFSP